MPCNGATFTSSGDGCRKQPESEAVFGPLGLGGLTSTTSPEIGGYLDTHPRVRLLTWQSTATNRMLFDAGFGAYQSPFGPRESPGNTTRGTRANHRAVCRRVPANGGIPNLTYRSANWGHSWDAQYTWRASVSYVTGAHNLKIGYGGVALVSDLENHTNDLNLTYTVSNGVPISLTQSLLPFTTSYRTRNASFYVQDQWTLGRMTLQGALRFDRNWSFSPEQTIPASAFLAIAAGLPGNARRDRLQRHLAARRRGVRPLRQREDGREGELRQVPGADEQQQQLHPVEPDRPHRDDGGARVDRFERQLGAGLRPAESGGAEPDGHRW